MFEYTKGNIAYNAIIRTINAFYICTSATSKMFYSNNRLQFHVWSIITCTWIYCLSVFYFDSFFKSRTHMYLNRKYSLTIIYLLSEFGTNSMSLKILYKCNHYFQRNDALFFNHSCLKVVDIPICIPIKWKIFFVYCHNKLMHLLIKTLNNWRFWNTFLRFIAKHESLNPWT